jgi:hypothetical protein
MNGVPLECLEDSDLHVPEKCASLLFERFRFICSGKMCKFVVWKIPIYMFRKNVQVCCLEDSDLYVPEKCARKMTKNRSLIRK